MNRCIKEGEKAFIKSNGKKYINPYKLGSNEYNDYERGWMQALKRSPDSLWKTTSYK